MATCYRSTSGGTGNWSDDSGTWVTTSGGGTPINHPVAGDTAYLDANSGAVTVDVNSACTTLDMTGYTSTLALGARALTVSGNVTIGTTVGSVATLTIGISGGTGLSIGGDLLVALRGVITCVGASKVYASGSWDVSAGTFTASTGTVIYNAAATGKTVRSGSNTYYNVTWDGSGGAWTLLDNFQQARAPAMTLGTLHFDGFAYTSSQNSVTTTLGNGFTLDIGTGYLAWATLTGLTVPSGATLTASTGWTAASRSLTVSGSGGVAITGSGTWTIYGNIDINTSASCNFGTATFIQRLSGTLYSNQPLYNYQCGTGNSGDKSVTLLSNLTVYNAFTIYDHPTATHTFSAGIYALTVGGNFANGDVFTAGTGMVVFNDASKVTTVTGNTTFNVLSITTPDKVVKFTAGTTTTVASLVATGTAGHNTVLSNVSGVGTWAISDAIGTNSVSYCTISYSAAAGGSAWLAYTSNGCVDGGNNSGWVFAVASTFPAMLIGGD